MEEKEKIEENPYVWTKQPKQTKTKMPHFSV
jgi:hypothetical protein